MDDLLRQVRIARRRLVLQQFLAILVWSLGTTLLVAAVGVAIPKFHPVAVDSSAWMTAWIAGGLAAGLLVAAVLTWVGRKNRLEAAIELDRRFALKERVSSCLALSPEERQSEAGQALLEDALQRVTQVDVRQQFHVAPGKAIAFPIVAALIVFTLTLLTDARPGQQQQAGAATMSSKKQIKTSVEQLKKKIEQRRKEAVARGLKEADDLFKQLEMGADELARKDVADRKKALVKLNDLAKQIREKQASMASPDQLRRQLSNLKNIKQGPAEKMARAMQKGDFAQALEQLKSLEEQLKSNKMSPEDRQKLQQQLGDMKEALKQMTAAHEQAKEQLREEIKRRVAQGDRETAAELQKKLDSLSRMNPQMDNLRQMAQQLDQASQALQEGNAQEAAAQLSQLAENLQQLDQDLAEMEMLGEALDQLADAKSAMACENCQGMGCSMCQGAGSGDMLGQMPGMGQGLGQGRGQGDRPEEETNTGFYDSQVRADPRPGQAAITGTAGGRNRAGDAQEQLKAELDATLHGNDDPLTGQRLPKPQRDLARQYFDAFRKGE